VLVVASAGGHIAQAMRICQLADVSPESHVVTFDTPQTQRLTKDWARTFVPYIRPRDYRGVLRAVPTVRRLLREQNFDAVISTGSAVALAALPTARAHSTRAIYVESFARFYGPSRSGRIIGRMKGVETYTQHATWQDDRWTYVGDTMPRLSESDLTPSRDPYRQPGSPRVFVTLGTIEKYRFDALVDRLVDAIPDGWDITWQLGVTKRTGLPGRAFGLLPADDFTRITDESDIVISHGGVGSAMAILELSKPSIFVPRRACRSEHVDDHQVQLCTELARRRLALYREVDELTTADLEKCLAQVQLAS
jgi:UDP-N-acetylglucosamine transferase subunit ALG13